MWRFILFVIILFGLLGAVLYFKGPTEIIPFNNNGTSKDDPGLNKVTQPLTMTVPSAPRTTTNPTRPPLTDPIRVWAAALAPIEAAEVYSRVDGVLKELYVGLGGVVKPGQILAQIDDSLVQKRVLAEKAKAFSDTGINRAQASVNVYQSIVNKDSAIKTSGAVSDLEREVHIAQLLQYKAELEKAYEDQMISRLEYEFRVKELEQYRIVSEIHGEVVKIGKRPGDSVRTIDSMFLIVNSDRLWVEGLIDSERAAMLKAGMRALVEPERKESPRRELRLHTDTVNGLAVSPDGRLLASVSSDGYLILWDCESGRALWRDTVKSRQVELFAVDFSPVVQEQGDQRLYRLVVGCSDSVARIWTLQAKQHTLQAAPPEVLTDAAGHASGRIQSVRFSPNGQYIATGGTDLMVCLWQASDRKCMYKVLASPGAGTTHRGAITTLHITGDGHLITAATDKTLKYWRLGQKTAELIRIFDGRSGDVAKLGVSPDGQRVLFDHEDELRIVQLATGQVEGVIRGRHGHFRQLAQFSPNGHEVLTTSGNSRLQLWTTPAPPEVDDFFRHGYQVGFNKNTPFLLGMLAHRLCPDYYLTSAMITMVAGPQPLYPPLPRMVSVPSFAGWIASTHFPLMELRVLPYHQHTAIPELWSLRSYELRYYAAGEEEITCAAFLPESRMVFTSGKDKVIRMWMRPSPMEAQEPIEASLTYVGKQVEMGTDYVRIRAVLDNPNDYRRLQVGNRVNLTLYPGSTTVVP